MKILWKTLELTLLLALIEAPLKGADGTNLATFTRVSEIHRLSRGQASLAFPVSLRGVVTYSDPQWNLLFIHDGSGGVFVSLEEGNYPTNSELVEVVGRTGEGSTLPVVTGASWQHLGAGKLPEARLLGQIGQLAAEIDCQWSELVGVVRGVTLNGDRNHLQIDITGQGWRARLFLPVPAGGEEALNQWIDAKVSATGVGGLDYSDDRGGISFKSFIPSPEFLRVLEQPNPDPFLLPYVPLAKVRGFSGTNAPAHRIHIRGTTTYLHPPNELVLQDESNAVRVAVRDPKLFKVGDSFEAVGFIDPGVFSPVVEDALFRPLSSQAHVEPVSVTPATVLWGDYDARLVQLTGVLQNHNGAATNHVLTLLQDGILLGVSLESAPAFTWDWAQLKKGDCVRVTGVCAIQGRQRGAPQSFQVLVRAESDVVRLPGVRVFSARQVLTIVLVAGAAWGAVLLWGVLLRRRVGEQTKELASSLSLLSATIESTPDGILVIDRDGRMTSCNTKFVKMWGLPPEVVKSKDDGRLLAFVLAQLQDSGTFLTKVRELYENPEAEGFDTLELKDGRVFERYSQPQRLEGRCVGRVWCFRDVTARKQAEAESAYERSLLETLLETFPDLIFFKDRQSRFVRYSSSFGKLFKLADHESLKGKTHLEFFSEAHAQQAYADEQEIIRTGKPITGKLEKQTHADASVSWALTSKMPWRDKAGNIVGTFGISKDVSSIKEAEANLEAAHHQLLETSRRLGMAEVATTVLHNVGNVLNSVNVSATLVNDRLSQSRANYLAQAAEMLGERMDDLAVFLTQDPKGKKLRDYLKEVSQALLRENAGIRTEVQSLRKNIEHIKTIVAMQQSYARVSGTLEMLDPKDLMEDAIQINWAAFERDQIQLVREFRPVPKVLVDRHKVLQILINLLSNARHAVQPTCKQQRCVSLSIFANGPERIALQVSDNGVGIPPDNLNRIFNQGFTTREDGHGFGLHSGANAAKEMNGSLQVQSNGSGKGAAFTLELPVTKDSATVSFC